MSASGRSGSYATWGKRILDVAVSGLSLLLLVPFLAVIAALVRWRLGRPVIFRQIRPGFLGKPFAIFKFRTMADLRSASGELLDDDARLLPLGRALRKSSLDELPELWNVLRGDMSLVGPRPLLMEYVPLYDEVQRRRHDVRPGITGWAQVNGRNLLSWAEKFEMDVWYVENLSLPLDMRILWRTLASVLLRRGISADGHATMPKFTGTGP
jgi:lipopolysaccharide/colanic/teichoic acid biosynthesis glycosyltransferase